MIELENYELRVKSVVVYLKRGLQCLASGYTLMQREAS